MKIVGFTSITGPVKTREALCKQQHLGLQEGHCCTHIMCGAFKTAPESVPQHPPPPRFK